ncbi:MAG: pentapeptide repeat-containing protein [Alphaproteobacteria bacterium]|nr:pentapeptide repeat-containing protein [Alphaproteobacteria bacterium]
MSKKYKKQSIISVLIALFSNVATASVVNNNMVVYYLPATDVSHTNDIERSLNKKTIKGSLFSPVSNQSSVSNKNDHEISIKSGVSLVDKPETISEEDALDKILIPAKVVVLPDGKLKKRSKSVVKTGTELDPISVQIFPIKPEKVQQESKGQILAKKKLLVKQVPHSKKGGRPNDEKKWTAWVLDELTKCNVNKKIVLPTLYWMLDNKKLTDGQTDCSMKQAVAEYLQKCHPWPVKYYTPINNDVVVNENVQMSVEILETTFDTKECPFIDVSHVNFEKVDFINGNLKGVLFSNSYFKEANFQNTDISEASFERSILDNVLFRDVDMSATYMPHVMLNFSKFYKTNLSKTNMEFSNLDNVQFDDVDLSFAKFRESKVNNTFWRDVLAFNSNFTFSVFRNSSLQNVLFDYSLAERADLTEIFCDKCSFSYVNSQYTLFDNSFLKNTSFMGAQLLYASFKNVQLDDKIVFDKAMMAKTDFSGVDLSKNKEISLDKLKNIVIDEKTKVSFPDFEVASYDLEYMHKRYPKKFVCSQNYCSSLKYGRVNAQNVAVRAMTVLSKDSDTSMKENLWAVCTLGCLANDSKTLDHESADVLTYFIKKKIPWNTEQDLFSYAKPITEDVQLAMKMLLDNSLKKDYGYVVDLSFLDLRNFDFSHLDLRNVTFANSNLSGAIFSGSKTDLEFKYFDKVVIDQFTVLPQVMRDFSPFKLPENVMPSWWKPNSVKVLVYGDVPWKKITEEISFIDEYLVAVKDNLKEKDDED